jgi:hypothetical protein
MMKKRWVTLVSRYYEGDDDDKGGGDDDGDKGDEKKFTQADVNRMMADNKRGMQTRIQELQDQLDKGTAPEDIEKLQGKISSLQEDLSTTTKRSSDELQKAEKKHAKELAEAQESATNNFNLYAKFRMDQELTQAAVSQEAINPQQILGQLRSKSTLDEIFDSDGKSTGEYRVKVKIENTDKDGKEETLMLSPVEAVKSLKENTMHANLFKGTGVGGMGSRNEGTGGDDRPPSDPAAYRKWRKEKGL